MPISPSKGAVGVGIMVAYNLYCGDTTFLKTSQRVSLCFCELPAPDDE
jgi:hypothetical protein